MAGEALSHTERTASVKSRIFMVLGALTLVIGVGIGNAGVASADSQYQYCNNGYCLNAWNEGPYVDAYHTNVVNNDFFVYLNLNTTWWNIKYTGPGGFQGMCIGDYGNTSGDARAALENCQGGSVPWGGNFDQVECTNSTGGFAGYAYKDIHWKGWLTPNSHSDGSPFYLNSQTPTCFTSGAAG